MAFNLFDLRQGKAKLTWGIIAAIIIAFLLWPRFRGTTNKYEDEYLADF